MAKSSITITAVFLALAIGGGAFFVGYLMGNNWMINTDPTQLTPTIDGIIEKREWLRSSYYNIPFYLDVDNEIDPVVDKANVDGWNYLSVAEDDDFYYIALDLCSDRTDNQDGEWLAFHLANRLPDTWGSKLAFFALEDYGYEYLYYNVSGDNVFDFGLNPIPSTRAYPDIPIVPETDTLEVLRGNTTGDFYDFWTEYDNKNYTGTSNYYETDGAWLAGDFLDIQFGVNITEKIPDEIVGLFMASITDMDLEYRLKSNLTSNPIGHYGVPNEFYCSVAEHGGMPINMSDSFTFLSDVNEISFAADTIVSGSVDINHNNINASNGMFYFTIHCWNDPDVVPTAYELQIDKLSLKITGGDIASIVGNTVASGNYDIAYTYGSSENCAEDHRIFEFKIAKSEFPPLDDEFLYLNVAGYGTMAIVGTNYWMYPLYGYPLPPVYWSISDSHAFLALDMSIT